MQSQYTSCDARPLIRRPALSIAVSNNSCPYSNSYSLQTASLTPTISSNSSVTPLAGKQHLCQIQDCSFRPFFIINVTVPYRLSPPYTYYEPQATSMTLTETSTLLSYAPAYSRHQLRNSSLNDNPPPLSSCAARVPGA
jgi:hypothetical protein